MEKITSRSNPKIKSALALYDNKERKKKSQFIIEGARLCEDAALSDIHISTLFVTEEAIEKYSDRLQTIKDKSDSCFCITNEISISLSDTKSPQGVFCVCEIPQAAHVTGKLCTPGKYIALENIQSPDNLGAICRTAEALGISGIIVSGGCDIYNPKAQRSAMGSLLRLPVIEAESLPAFLGECKKAKFTTMATTPKSDAVKITQADMSGGVICVIGNEGSGITESTANACDVSITIPMLGRAQSLNAAGAAAIVMWEMVKSAH